MSIHEPDKRQNAIAKVIAGMNVFDAECAVREYTDTSAVWELLDVWREELKLLLTRKQLAELETKRRTLFAPLHESRESRVGGGRMTKTNSFAWSPPGRSQLYSPFKEGDRIRLLSMGDDPYPIPAGTTGTVIDDPVWFETSWTVTVKWDIPRSLNLVMPPDRAELIT